MKILFVSQYFLPEIEAGAFRIYETAKFFLNYGHQVTVLCGLPNFPTGKILASYKGKFVTKENVEGIEVIRTWVFPTKNEGFIKRILNYVSFIFSGSFTSLWIGQFDVVIATSPPLFAGLIGVFISRTKKIPLVFEVRDIWPASAQALGLLHNKLLLRLLEGLEKWIYRCSKKIVVVTCGYVDDLVKKGVPRDRLEIIPNGIDMTLPALASGKSDILDQLKLRDKFLVLYAGTHGISQGLATLIETACQLKSYRDIAFLLIGEGADKSALVAQANKMGLNNVYFINQISRPKLHEIMACCNVTVVHLKRNPLFLSVVPSKLYESMAFSKPVVLGVEGEAKQILEASGGGLCITPESTREMKEAILEFYNNKNFTTKCGENGRKFVEKNYSREKTAKKYSDIVNSLGKSHFEKKINRISKS